MMHIHGSGYLASYL